MSRRVRIPGILFAAPMFPPGPPRGSFGIVMALVVVLGIARNKTDITEYLELNGKPK